MILDPWALKNIDSSLNWILLAHCGKRSTCRPSVWVMESSLKVLTSDHTATRTRGPRFTFAKLRSKQPEGEPATPATETGTFFTMLQQVAGSWWVKKEFHGPLVYRSTSGQSHTYHLSWFYIVVAIVVTIYIPLLFLVILLLVVVPLARKPKAQSSLRPIILPHASFFPTLKPFPSKDHPKC